MQELTQQTRTLPESKKLAQQMLQYRLIWYRRIMAERLLRFKHAIILVLASAVPAIPAIPHILGSPLLFVLSAHPQSPAWLISFSSLLIHIAYVLWIAVQKGAIIGGNTRKYLLTLPISNTLWEKTDFKLLLIANSVFWLPILFSFIYIFIPSNPTNDPPALMSLHWLLLTSSLLISQWLYLQKRLDMLLFVLFFTSGILGLVTIVTNTHLDISITLIGIIFNGLIGTQHELFAHLLPKKELKTKIIRHKSFTQHTLWRKWSGLLKINFSILFRGYRQESYLRLFLCLASLALIYQLSLFSSAGIEFMYPFAGAACLLITSGWYNKLVIERQKYRLFLNSLPIQAGFWVFLDIFTLSSLIFLMQLVFFIPYFIAQEFKFSTFLTLMLAEIPLTTLIYICQTRLSKQCLLASTLSTGIWLYLLLI